MTTPEPDAAEPAAAGTPVLPERRLHPWSWLFVLVQQLKQFIVPLGALVLVGQRGDGYQWISLVGVGVLALVSVWQYFTFRYGIADDRLVLRSGLLERQVRQIPFARIHNVALHQSLLHRLFGVAEVRLESAGGDEPEAQMRVLRLEEALALERLVRRRSAAAADGADAGTGAAAATEAETGTPLLALPVGEVVRLGLISNRGMVVVAGAFALGWQVFPERVMRNAVHDAWTQAFGYASHLGGDWWLRGAFLAALVLLALVVLRGFSVVLALLRYHDFRLEAHGRRLTVSRGLLSRLRTSASRRRIQTFALHEGLLHRLFRRRALTVATAAGGGRGDGGQGESRALRELAPVATPAACDALLREVAPGIAWPPAAWRPLPARAWLRLLWPGIVLALVATAVAGWRFGGWGLLALAWIPWAAFAARRHAAHAGYALDARLFAVREGWWSRHWCLAELDRVQALQLRRSWLDRRCGTASLWLDTPGAKLLGNRLRVRFLPLAEARALQAAIAAEVARRPLRW